jgi:hypothetical protein
MAESNIQQELLRLFQQQQQQPNIELNTGLLSENQQGLSDVFSNPDQAQVNALVGGLAGLVNPRGRDPALMAVAQGAQAFQNTRMQDYQRRVEGEKLRQENLKNQLQGALGIANFGTAQDRIAEDQRQFGITENRAERNLAFDQSKTDKTGSVQLPDGSYRRGFVRQGRLFSFDENGKTVDLSGQGASFVPDTTRTNTVTEQGAFKIPAGFMLADPSDSSKGVKPIPGGPHDKLTPEQAAKAQLIQGALDNQDVIDSLLFKEDGTVDRTNVATATVKAPFSEGRTMNVVLKDSLEAKIRAESGAAVPDTEITRLSERFMPSVIDSDETIRVKRALLKQFLNGTFDKFDPTGRFLRNDTINGAVKLMDKASKGTVKMYGNVPVIIEDD